MRPAAIVEGQITTDRGAGLADTGVALQLRISPQMSLPCCGLVSASEAGPLQDVCDRDGSLGQFQDKAADFLDGPADETDRRRGGAGVFFGVGRVLAWCRTAAITA